MSSAQRRRSLQQLNEASTGEQAPRMPILENTMSDNTQQVLPKLKKSVALSGVAAGNTALCTVGRTGNDLHNRGYDNHEIATTCEFEEIAYLLIYGSLPSRAELTCFFVKL